MKIIISGGGTGGHIYPALAIADGLMSTLQGLEIIYVGTKNSMEEELAVKAGYNFEAIRVKGMPRRLDKRSVKAVWNLILGIFDSRKLIKDIKPELVIGTGGYVSGPIVFVAGISGIPVVIHEQNAFPGITNKLLSRIANRVLITYPDSAKFFKHPDRTVVTGNPIRKDISGIGKHEAMKALNLDPSKKFVLSFGGSGGQKSLNQTMLAILIAGLWPGNIQLLHVTGAKHHESFIKSLDDNGIILSEYVRIEPYYYGMPLAMNASDLVVTSGGAITLAEISAIGLPSILIPKSYTAENHQEFNVRAFEKAGAAIVILEKDLNSEVLAQEIDKLLRDEDRLALMSKNSRILGKPEAADTIINELILMLNN